MIIVIQEGPGFPLISEGSHVIDITSVSTTSMRTIPQANGSVVVFHAGIACQYPAVKGVGGTGSYCSIRMDYWVSFRVRVVSQA